MPVLTDAELRIVVEVVTELAKLRCTAFDKTRKGAAFARAALIDPAFKARLVQIHRRLEARRNTDLPRRMLAPLLRELERDAANGIAFAKLNVDEHPELAARYDVLSIPTVIAFARGEARGALVGARPRGQVERWLAEMLPAGELDGLAVQGQRDA